MSNLINDDVFGEAEDTLTPAVSSGVPIAEPNKQINELSDEELGNMMAGIWNGSLTRAEQEALVIQSINILEQRGALPGDILTREHHGGATTHFEAEAEVYTTPVKRTLVKRRTYGMFAMHPPERTHRINDPFLFERSDSSIDEEPPCKMAKTASGAASKDPKRTRGRGRAAPAPTATTPILDSQTTASERSSRPEDVRISIAGQASRHYELQ